MRCPVALIPAAASASIVLVTLAWLRSEAWFEAVLQRSKPLAASPAASLCGARSRLPLFTDDGLAAGEPTSRAVRAR